MGRWRRPPGPPEYSHSLRVLSTISEIVGLSETFNANEEGLQRRIFLLGAALAGQRLHQETDLDPGRVG